MTPSRRLLVLSAGALVLASNALLLALAAREHTGERASTLVLTERELRLRPWGEEKAWAYLVLDWNREDAWKEREPGWLGAGRLAELGFDTRLAPTDEGASAFYGWQPPREAWVVLELGEPDPGPKGGATRSRLQVVDAALGPGELRSRHPDPSRAAIVRAVLSAEVRRPRDRETGKEGPPYVRGRVDDLLVGEIQLPKERRALLDRLASGDAAKGAGPVRSGAPRYEAVVRFSRRGAPTVETVRELGP